jgi:branched-chain amino acid transport system permease protein
LYGIIELINFAHGGVHDRDHVAHAGDLGARLFLRQTANCPRRCSSRCLWLTARVDSYRKLNVAIRRIAYRRLRNAPRLAPLITAIGSVHLVNVGLVRRRWVNFPISCRASTS